MDEGPVADGVLAIDNCHDQYTIPTLNEKQKLFFETITSVIVYMFSFISPR